MAAKRRSPTPAAAPVDNLTRPVQTKVSPQVGALLDEKISKLRVKEAHYVRSLIERDLGVLAAEDPDHV